MRRFSKSVDRELILKSIYDPIFPGSELLQCGQWVPTVGKWCDNTQFEGSFDPAAAEALLDRGRLGQGRQRLLGQGRRRAGDPLDDQHRQQAP